MKRLLAAILVAGMLLPSRAPTQTKLELHGGDRLRLTREVTVRNVFWLRGLQGDTLMVSTKRYSDAFAVAPGDLNRFEVLVPRSTGSGALHGLGVGMLLGAAAGVVTGVIIGSTGMYGGGDPEPWFAALVLSVPSAVAGGIIGSIAGLIAPGRTWQEVDLPVRIDLTLAPVGGGPAIGTKKTAGALMVSLGIEF